MKECCKTCVFCRCIKTPSITGNPIDFVCQKKGAVIEDIEIKCCDTMYESIPTMYYPQVDGITPTVINADKENKK